MKSLIVRHFGPFQLRRIRIHTSATEMQRSRWSTTTSSYFFKSFCRQIVCCVNEQRQRLTDSCLSKYRISKTKRCVGSTGVYISAKRCYRCEVRRIPKYITIIIIITRTVREVQWDAGRGETKETFRLSRRVYFCSRDASIIRCFDQSHRRRFLCVDIPFRDPKHVQYACPCIIYRAAFLKLWDVFLII